MFIYIPYRTGILEKKYVKSLIYTSEKIKGSLNTFEKGKNIKKKNLARFLNQTRKKYTDLAIVAIADNEMRILIELKNDKYIKDNETFDSILNSFAKNDIKIFNQR